MIAYYHATSLYADVEKYQDAIPYLIGYFRTKNKSRIVLPYSDEAMYRLFVKMYHQDYSFKTEIGHKLFFKDNEFTTFLFSTDNSYSLL